MNLRSIAPAPPLDRIVDTFIHYTEYRPDHRIERVIPDGSAYLVFALDGMPRRTYNNETLQERAVYTGAWLSGPQEQFISIEARQKSAMVALRFVPGGASAVLDDSLEHYTNRIVQAEDVFGDDVEFIRTELALGTDAEDAWRIVRSWLETRIRATGARPDWLAAAIEGIVRDPTFAQTSLTDLVRESGHSQKQFISQFRRHVGLAPKTFQRILRFSEILPRIVEKREVSWTDVSYECGYYDQSHFIREFRLFSGYNPADFLRGPTSQRTNFFPIG